VPKWLEFRRSLRAGGGHRARAERTRARRRGATRSWRELDRNANALALHLARRHQPGEKIALYSYNRPEFVETLVAAFKARLVR